MCARLQGAGGRQIAAVGTQVHRPSPGASCTLLRSALLSALASIGPRGHFIAVPCAWRPSRIATQSTQHDHTLPRSPGAEDAVLFVEPRSTSASWRLSFKARRWQGHAPASALTALVEQGRSASSCAWRSSQPLRCGAAWACDWHEVGPPARQLVRRWPAARAQSIAPGSRYFDATPLPLACRRKWPWRRPWMLPCSSWRGAGSAAASRCPALRPG